MYHINENIIFKENNDDIFALDFDSVNKYRIGKNEKNSKI